MEPEELAFFGFQTLFEDGEFALVIGPDDQPQIIDKQSPHIFVDDINDAAHIARRTEQHLITISNEKNA